MGARQPRRHVLGLSTETTATALSWLWPLLCEHPKVAARLYDEIDRVVGRDRVRPDHLEGLAYTKQVVQELLRLYPVGWQFPRMVVRDGVLGGVPVKAGQTLLISPYLTQHLASVWERPAEFDPDRFAPEHSGGTATPTSRSAAGRTSASATTSSPSRRS